MFDTLRLEQLLHLNHTITFELMNLMKYQKAT